ncbi:MAG: DUF4126 domain-containing protein [Ignavibacteria bacterium]
MADNALDTISGPLAMIAGTVLTASFLDRYKSSCSMDSWDNCRRRNCGIVKVGASAARLTSSATTGGLGNHAVATTENVMSVVTSILAFILPSLLHLS